MRRIAKSFGKPYPFDVRMKIMGTTEQRSAEIAVTDLKLPLTVSEYLDRYNILCREMLGRGSLLKGWFLNTPLYLYIICSINYIMTSIYRVPVIDFVLEIGTCLL